MLIKVNHISVLKFPSYLFPRLNPPTELTSAPQCGTLAISFVGTDGFICHHALFNYPSFPSQNSWPRLSNASLISMFYILLTFTCSEYPHTYCRWTRVPNAQSINHVSLELFYLTEFWFFLYCSLLLLFYKYRTVSEISITYIIIVLVVDNRLLSRSESRTTVWNNVLCTVNLLISGADLYAAIEDIAFEFENIDLYTFEPSDFHESTIFKSLASDLESAADDRISRDCRSNVNVKSTNCLIFTSGTTGTLKKLYIWFM